MKRFVWLLLLACGAREHHVYRLPSACRDADRADAERCGARLLDEMMTARLGVYEDPALERYVRRVGARVAAASGRDDVDWTFRVLDEPGVQAWAAPGGFVYVTRGLLAVLDSEAELAAVLAHEVAHVAAGHTEELMHRLPEPTVREVDLATLFQLHRDDEAQADQLGVRYAADAGYDGRALQRALRAIHRAGRAERTPPSWLDRHPPLATRLALAARVAGGEPAGREGRRRYLQALDGLVVGADPRRGVVANGRFVHAAAGLSFRVPAGWTYGSAGEPGALRTQWFHARSADESMALLFFPLSHARGSMLEAAVEAEMRHAPTRERRLAGARVVEGRMRTEGEELHFDRRVAEVRMLILHAHDGHRYGLMVAAHRAEDGRPRELEELYRSLTESFRREPRGPVAARRIRPRRIDAGTSLAALMASGCGRADEASLVARLNGLALEGTVASERTLKCLAP